MQASGIMTDVICRITDDDHTTLQPRHDGITPITPTYQTDEIDLQEMLPGSGMADEADVRNSSGGEHCQTSLNS